MDNPSVIKSSILKYEQSDLKETEDALVIEEPLEISLTALESTPTIYRKPISITMRTPSHDKELAVGFLHGEGIISTSENIKQIRTEENKVDIVLQHSGGIDLKKLERHFYTTSSCGICGKASIESLEQIAAPSNSPAAIKVNKEIILRLPDQIRNQQSLFKETGGIHAAAMADTDGKILCLREDVGRHNAMDKLVGHYFLKAELPLEKQILVLSGRASFELLQKAIMAGIQIVISIGAPSSLALAIAQNYNVTLIGFAKGDRFNIYHGQERVII